jgi:acetyl-CoA carboxylase biotin carboxyl carrier protein
VSDDSGRVPGPTSDLGRGSLEALTDEVLPALIARLRASRLGELEVRTDGWRVRLRREAASLRSHAAGAGGAADPGDDAILAGSVARSPAVGYFSPAPELAIGRSVQAGDLLGSIDVLGIVQELVAGAEGIVSSILAEEGQAVEYGQALVEIDALEVDVEPPGQESAGTRGGPGR